MVADVDSGCGCPGLRRRDAPKFLYSIPGRRYRRIRRLGLVVPARIEIVRTDCWSDEAQTFRQ